MRAVPEAVVEYLAGQLAPISALANLFMHYAFDSWLEREFPTVEFERYADDAVYGQHAIWQDWPSG